ncbi:hypothetical protein RhiirA4_415309 [Rhizophagus irregularis]|uniref:Uncharacterized protein n=1 Tax=Rhizophagus irregularis TaxID=588596 RepID=A0A2I1FZH7_9GLOM|nr:hypothetical protein RhiirA4_415309 [Rhizophagus irregularis]
MATPSAKKMTKLSVELVKSLPDASSLVKCLSATKSGLNERALEFLQQQQISGEDFLELTQSDLDSRWLEIGPVKSILRKIDIIQKGEELIEVAYFIAKKPLVVGDIVRYVREGKTYDCKVTEFDDISLSVSLTYDGKDYASPKFMELKTIEPLERWILNTVGLGESSQQNDLDEKFHLIRAGVELGSLKEVRELYHST